MKAIRNGGPASVLVALAIVGALVGGGFLTLLSLPRESHAQGQDRAPAIERTTSAIAFRNDMRKLWEDHIVWTRMFIVSFASDGADADETAARLLANQDDIGDAIKPFYGDAAGEQLTQLLREHILGAVT